MSPWTKHSPAPRRTAKHTPTRLRSLAAPLLLPAPDYLSTRSGSVLDIRRLPADAVSLDAVSLVTLKNLTCRASSKRIRGGRRTTIKLCRDLCLDVAMPAAFISLPQRLSSCVGKPITSDPYSKQYKTVHTILCISWYMH